MVDTTTPNLALTNQTNGGNSSTWGDIADANFTTIDQYLGFDLGRGMIGGKLSVSVGASALTIAVKTTAGNDPSANEPVIVLFRSSTKTVGTVSTIVLTAATSFTISAGSTLGAVANVFFRLWVVGVNDSGTFRLGVINPSWETDLDESQQRSSTAEGGAGAADSANVLYTGTAVSSKAFRILGLLEYTNGLATPGAWSAVPDITHMFGIGTAGLLPRAKAHFRAYKSSSQTGITTTTQITFDTEVFDVGSCFASNAWTPPAGPVVFEASVIFSSVNSDTYTSLIIYKNGSPLVGTANSFYDADGSFSSSVSGGVFFGDGLGLNVRVVDQANGTDVYTVWAAGNDASFTAVGGSGVTWCQGYSL